MDIKEFKTDKPNDYVWKLLSYLKDKEYVVDIIKNQCKNEKIETNKLKRNFNKQAEEYFLSLKSNISLAIKPLLLYYGIVSLTQALVLVKKDGLYSIDKLRNDRKHNHHGLENDFTLLGMDKINLETFLNSIKCKVHTNKGVPWGQFSLFYDVLQPNFGVFNYDMYNKINRISYKRKGIYGYSDKVVIDSLIQEKICLNRLIKILPDMYMTMKNFNINMDLYRGLHAGKIIKDTAFETITNSYFIHNISIPDQDVLTNFYKEKNSELIKIFSDESNITLKENIKYKFNVSTPLRIYEPCRVESDSGDVYYIKKPNKYIMETASHYIITYCLGMLARYFPDYWMKVINNFRIRAFIDELVSIIECRFPKLIIDQFFNCKHLINN